MRGCPRCLSRGELRGRTWRGLRKGGCFCWTLPLQGAENRPFYHGGRLCFYSDKTVLLLRKTSDASRIKLPSHRRKLSPTPDGLCAVGRWPAVFRSTASETSSEGVTFSPYFPDFSQGTSKVYLLQWATFLQMLRPQTAMPSPPNESNCRPGLCPRDSLSLRS